MNEHTSTAGNNVFSKTEYDAARSHALVMHHALLELGWDWKTCGELATRLSTDMRAGVFFTDEQVREVVQTIRELIAPIAKKRDYDIPVALTSELNRAAGALLDLLPLGDSR